MYIVLCCHRKKCVIWSQFKTLCNACYNSYFPMIYYTKIFFFYLRLDFKNHFRSCFKLFLWVLLFCFPLPIGPKSFSSNYFRGKNRGQSESVPYFFHFLFFWCNHSSLCVWKSGKMLLLKTFFFVIWKRIAF